MQGSYNPLEDAHGNVTTYGWQLTLLGLVLLFFSELLWKGRKPNRYCAGLEWNCRHRARRFETGRETGKNHASGRMSGGSQRGYTYAIILTKARTINSCT